MKQVFDKIVPARQGLALVVKKGQFVRVAEVEGGQIVDFVVLNADNTRERFSQARTKANQGKIYVTSYTLGST